MENIFGELWGIVGEIHYLCPRITKKRKGMRFLGNIEAKTDQKGRVFLPSVFRKELQASGEERLVMRMDVHEKCLMLFPESVWNAKMDAMFSNADEWDAVEKKVVRMYMADVEILQLDGNGRILIPARYLKEAEIDSTVRFIGLNHKIELWAPHNLEKPKLSQDEFAAMLKTIMARSRRNQQEDD